MTREVVALPADADVAEAARLMLERRIKSIPIVQGRQVVGIVARRDLLAVLARSDEEIASALEALLTDELGPPSPFRVTVRDGVAQLSGPSDPTTRQLATRLACGVPGSSGSASARSDDGPTAAGHGQCWWMAPEGWDLRPW